MNRAGRSRLNAVRTARLSSAEPQRSCPSCPSLLHVVPLSSLLAAAALALPAGAGEGTLEFLPTPSGNVGAFLLAGPFEKPQGVIEQMGPAREGAELPGGLKWRVALTRDGNGIVVGSTGARGGIHYARTEFAEGTAPS